MHRLTEKTRLIEEVKMKSSRLSDRELSHASSALRLEERVYNELLSRIYARTYAMGERLPPEKTLADEFGVSRPVIRAALASLRSDGVVISRRGAGSFVSSMSAENNAGYSALSHVDDIGPMYAFRMLIEGESASLAAQNPNFDKLEKMRADAVQMQTALVSGAISVEQDIVFHMDIARMGGNRFIIESIRMMQPHMFFIHRFLGSRRSAKDPNAKVPMVSEHLEIIEAIFDGNREEARARMAAHLAASAARIIVRD